MRKYPHIRPNGRPFHFLYVAPIDYSRVFCVGPFETRAEAESMAEDIAQLHIEYDSCAIDSLIVDANVSIGETDWIKKYADRDWVNAYLDWRSYYFTALHG